MFASSSWFLGQSDLRLMPKILAIFSDSKGDWFLGELWKIEGDFTAVIVCHSNGCLVNTFKWFRDIIVFTVCVYH